MNSARFTPVRRAEHGFVILCFAVLAVTGFAQKFYEAPWATWLLEAFGGVDGTRRVHHFVGVLSVVHLLLHLGAIFRGVATRRLQLSLFPAPQDLRDLVATWKYRFGFTQRRPVYPVFNYRQKFEYLGLLFGGAVVMFSGLILLYPQSAVLVLPGHVIPAAREAHLSDGMVAYLLLVAWHFYATVLSPET